MKKTALYILLGILGIVAMYYLTDYDGRMEKYNAHVCAVNGYEADCKTPLPEHRRLK